MWRALGLEEKGAAGGRRRADARMQATTLYGHGYCRIPEMSRACVARDDDLGCDEGPRLRVDGLPGCDCLGGRGMRSGRCCLVQIRGAKHNER